MCPTRPFLFIRLGLAVLTAYLIVVPLLAARVPASARWLPDTAWPAAFVWAVAMVAAWAVVLRHRDANT